MTGRPLADGISSNRPGDGRRTGLIALPDRQQMSPEQQKVYDDVVNGPRGTLIGPLRAVIHSPELADRWQKFGEYVRYRTVIPELHKELAILVCARRWNSELEWAVHGKIALQAGLEKSVLEDMAASRPVKFGDATCLDVFNFAREMLLFANVAAPLYDAVLRRWGERGIVELTAIVGYYSMVAMMLNVHQVPVPEAPAFAALDSTTSGLTDIPAAVSAGRCEAGGS